MLVWSKGTYKLHFDGIVAGGALYNVILYQFGYVFYHLDHPGWQTSVHTAFGLVRNKNRLITY
jgi:hypothetical protein